MDNINVCLLYKCNNKLFFVLCLICHHGRILLGYCWVLTSRRRCPRTSSNSLPTSPAMSEDSRSGRLRGPLVIVNPDEGDSLRAHNGRGTGPRPPNPKQQPKPADYDPHPYSDPARSPSSPPSTPSISSLFKIPTDPSPSSFYPPTSIPNNDRTNSDGTYTRKSMNNYPRPPLGGRPLPPVSRKSRTVRIQWLSPCLSANLTIVVSPVPNQPRSAALASGLVCIVWTSYHGHDGL